MNKYTPNTSEDLSFSILKQHYPHIFSINKKNFILRKRIFDSEIEKRFNVDSKIKFLDALLTDLSSTIGCDAFKLTYEALEDPDIAYEKAIKSLPTPEEFEAIKRVEEASHGTELSMSHLIEEIYDNEEKAINQKKAIEVINKYGYPLNYVVQKKLLGIIHARKNKNFDAIYSIVAWLYFEKEFYDYALKEYNELKDNKTENITKVVIVNQENLSSLSSPKPTQIKEIPDIKRKILFLTANPRDEQPLRLEGELRKVIDVLNGATHKNSLDYKIEPAVRIDIITKAMQIQKPEIVHFSGHGCVEGLAVEDYSGYSDLFPMEGLDRLFRLFKDTAKCVILNACDSKELAKTISKHGIYTVGMNDEIGDEAARKFAVGFYQSLGEGNNYESSFEIGMVHISNEYDDANTPELWFNGERIRN